MQGKSLFVWVTFLALFFGAISGSGTTYFLLKQDEKLDADEEPEMQVPSTDSSYEQAWEKAAPSVVSIVATGDVQSVFGTFKGETQGSGFMVSEDGLILTNRHVVSNEEAEYKVLLMDGTELPAEVVARDTLNDIALVKVLPSNGKTFTPVSFGDSDQLKVGQGVMAIGNALGQYSSTSTAGIVSATGRQLIASAGPQSENLVDLIQTDAAINPGNSGGPLVNLEGEVVGMNTAIASNGEGIGFALPSKDLLQVLDSYKEFGRIVRPFLGVRYVMVNEAVKKQFELDSDHGVMVLGDETNGFPAVIEDSPAEEAGLKTRDVILEVNGEEITELYSLTAVLAKHSVGDELVLKIWRDGKTLELTVKLEERKA